MTGQAAPAEVSNTINLIGISPEGARIPNPCSLCGRPATYGVRKRWYCTTCHLEEFRRAHGP